MRGGADATLLPCPPPHVHHSPMFTPTAATSRRHRTPTKNGGDHPRKIPSHFAPFHSTLVHIGSTNPPIQKSTSPLIHQTTSPPVHQSTSSYQSPSPVSALPKPSSSVPSPAQAAAVRPGTARRQLSARASLGRVCTSDRGSQPDGLAAGCGCVRASPPAGRLSVSVSLSVCLLDARSEEHRTGLVAPPAPSDT